MKKHVKAIVAGAVAGLAVAALLIGPLRATVNGDAHHLDACLTGANPTACHG